MTTQEQTQETNNEANMTNQQLANPQGMYPGMAPGMYPGMAPGMAPGVAPGMAPGMGPGMMPGMNPGMMPGMMGYGPQTFIYCQDPMTELAQSTGAIIRQEIEMFEVVTGCETQNRYNVFIQSSMGLKYAFRCIERSGCCCRTCCSANCRSLKMDIRHVASPNEDPELSKIFISASKPCAMGCCCLCRPHLDINLSDNNLYLGRIREPCTCCDIQTDIYNKNYELKYSIVGSCCQFGLCCGSSMEKMTEIEFRIKSQGKTVGVMKKLSSTVGEYFTKADSYKISFPNQATPEEKMLLICAGLLVDYQNFERDETPKNNRRGQ